MGSDKSIRDEHVLSPVLVAQTILPVGKEEVSVVVIGRSLLVVVRSTKPTSLTYGLLVMQSTVVHKIIVHLDSSR